ncbi:SPOR domain-containing protein [Stakelama saccharophila]|uniref:SPOR domain-containing protein n=1 Tax=Stakelama saccharophila TaxID=3075605 RepID=A0ABZ0B5J4_9SPHN|nr:SPOR domain-containing protein [Stakelama sp. W311]WNO52634.1 SPOR domain-containing protein [Stakelama sp. W311]
MNSRTILSLSVSALILGGTVVGCASTHPTLARAAASSEQLDSMAGKAREALAADKNADAVHYAEQLVAAAPRNANYRALLGRSYLASGRFLSAEQALGDALSLSPRDGNVALNLVLAQTAQGKWDAARETLTDHGDRIDPIDRGLALALAGDPEGALGILSQAARGPSASARARQNYALALALAGQWSAAKAVASVDVPASQLDARMTQWAQFAQPKRASDQVASLLGVQPVADSGQPVQLALNDSGAQLAAASVVSPGDDFVAVSPAVENDMSIAVAEPDAVPAPVATSAAPAAMPEIRFAARREVVQDIPVRVPHAAPQAVAKADRTASEPRAPKALTSGNFYVQLGAYENAAVAKDKWRHMRHRIQRLASLTPSGMSASVDGRQFYRLSVGGYSRGDAVSLCRQVRAHGGNCFVRGDAGDQMAQWVRKDVQLASR